MDDDASIFGRYYAGWYTQAALSSLQYTGPTVAHINQSSIACNQSASLDLHHPSAANVLISFYLDCFEFSIKHSQSFCVLVAVSNAVTSALTGILATMPQSALEDLVAKYIRIANKSIKKKKKKSADTDVYKEEWRRRPSKRSKGRRGSRDRCLFYVPLWWDGPTIHRRTFLKRWQPYQNILLNSEPQWVWEMKLNVYVVSSSEPILTTGRPTRSSLLKSNWKHWRM